MISYKKASFLISCLIACFLIIYRIYLANINGFEIYSSSHYLSDGTILFWRDEVTYLTWLDTRPNSFFEILSGERSATNLFGYFVGGIYLILGGWELTLFIGVLGLLFFYLSAELIIKDLPVNTKYAQNGLIVFLLCPTVIMLSSGVLRDLYILALVNVSIYFAFNRKFFVVVICMVMLYFLRNFYIVLVFPTLVYFYFYYSKNRNIHVLLASLCVLAPVFYAILFIPPLYSTTYTDLIFRCITALTGISVELLRPVENFSKGVLTSLEYLGLVYQCLITLVFYIFIIMKRFRVHYFIIVFIVTAISLSLIYGHFLGYFVSRTKLIILWMTVLYFMFSKNEL